MENHHIIDLAQLANLEKTMGEVSNETLRRLLSIYLGEIHSTLDKQKMAVDTLKRFGILLDNTASFKNTSQLNS